MPSQFATSYDHAGPAAVPRPLERRPAPGPLPPRRRRDRSRGRGGQPSQGSRAHGRDFDPRPEPASAPCQSRPQLRALRARPRQREGDRVPLGLPSLRRRLPRWRRHPVPPQAPQHLVPPPTCPHPTQRTVPAQGERCAMRGSRRSRCELVVARRSHGTEW
jgi:hypothetical protein